MLLNVEAHRSILSPNKKQPHIQIEKTSKNIGSDVTIVGAGIAGLWSAKEFLDRGFNVSVIERSEKLADGATTHNEGWLHSGIYHAVAIDNEESAICVAKKLYLGHKAIVGFASEAIDHDTTYALLGDDAAAHRDVNRWDQAGLDYEAISSSCYKNEDSINLEKQQTLFVTLPIY